MSWHCPVDSHISSRRWSSCRRKNRIPGDDTWIRKTFASFASECPVLALPQHVTLKPKCHWEELHKHGHVVNPAGACYRDVTTWFFPQCFACQDYKIFPIFSLQALIIFAFCWHNSILCYLTSAEHHLFISLHQWVHHLVVFTRSRWRKHLRYSNRIETGEKMHWEKWNNGNFTTILENKRNVFRC